MTDRPSAPLPGQRDDAMPGGELTPAHYERLLAISRRLAGTIRLDELLAQIVQIATDLLDAESASILFLDEEEEGMLRLEAALTSNGLTKNRAEVPVDASIAGWVVEQGEPLLTDDVSDDPRWADRVGEETPVDVRNVLGVPLRIGERITGCLLVFNKVEGRAFTEGDQAVLAALAGQAEVPIQNARRFGQSSLISEMVHELRTPLAAIKATMLVILRPEIPDDRREQMVTTVQLETNRLARMVTDFVALARLESGRIRMRRGPVDVAAVIREAAHLVKPQTEPLDIKIALDLPDDLPEAAGDAEQVRQVVVKLLENAVKYNEPGGHVRVAAGEQDGMLRVEVSDSGIGIDERSLPFVFDRFFRGQAAEGESPGSGLGLAIARCIVERLGGEIGAESEPGEGSTFWFTLPLS